MAYADRQGGAIKAQTVGVSDIPSLPYKISIMPLKYKINLLCIVGLAKALSKACEAMK
jgi:hypothetical protein